MSEFFLTVVNMSISASWIVLAVLVLRLLLKKAPKWISVLLWAIVAVRLVCPFTVESIMSLIPSAETISPEIMYDKTPEINTGVPVINGVINPAIGGSFTPMPGASANPLQAWIPVLAFVWGIGMFLLFVYTVVSYWRVKRKIGTAVLFRDNIYQSENVVSPFVLGIVKPRIYLPFHMNEQDMEHVVAHEQAHIRRKDHWWKPLGFLILTLHWFNPLMWLGYVLLCRDIELACDEKVVKEFDTAQRADYSQALLACSVNRRMIAACPLAFGEVGVKERVKSVLNYKKPAFWIIVTAIVASAVLAVCFLTSPVTKVSEEMSSFIEEKIMEHHYGGYKSEEFCCTDFKVLGTKKGKNGTSVYMWVLYSEYSCKDGEIKDEAGAHIPTVITVRKKENSERYELVEYWEPRDGSYYVKDIKEKFPWRLQGKALDTQLYIAEQMKNCDEKAREYFRLAANSEKIDLRPQIISVEALKEEYPQFFNLSTDGGLKVYIWQTAENNYKCYLINRFLDAITDQSFAFEVGATIEEMRLILSTYDIERKDVVIHPVVNPLSGYRYEIDEAYKEKINALFWSDASVSKNPTVEQLYNSIRIWDRRSPLDAESNPHFSVNIPELNYALIENRDDSKIYVDGEYLLGGPGNGCESFYLADITGDGKPELCFGMNAGSGIIDYNIVVFDYESRECIFSLSDRMRHDYFLFEGNGKLCVTETDFMTSDVTRTGMLIYDGAEISVLWGESEDGEGISQAKTEETAIGTRSTYTYEELSNMPAKELLDLFIKNGLVINDELKEQYTEEELQTLFKDNFHLWHTGVSAHSYTIYIDLAEQTKVVYDKIAE